MANIFIISAPSGAGKSSLIEGLIAKDNAIKKSISVTTRQPRSGEQNGQHYFFTSEADFQTRIKDGEFLEYALVHGNWYGTSKALVEKELEKQNDLILEIDYQGAQAIGSNSPLVFLFLFYHPTKLSCAHALKKEIRMTSRQLSNDSMRRATKSAILAIISMLSLTITLTRLLLN